MSKASYEDLRSLVDDAMQGKFDRKTLKQEREKREAEAAAKLTDKKGKRDLVTEAVTFLGRTT